MTLIYSMIMCYYTALYLYWSLNDSAVPSLVIIKCHIFSIDRELRQLHFHGQHIGVNTLTQ